jgi:subtilisin-like proprotein convertase family protein
MLSMKHSQLRRGFPSSLEPLEARIAPTGLVFAAGRGVINIFADNDLNGTYETKTSSFTPFIGYKGPISLAVGDFDGDQNAELVTAKGTGSSPEVKIWDISSGGFVTALSDAFVPFIGKGRGVSVGAGDIDGDGMDELVVGSGPGVPAAVKIYADADSDSVLSDGLVETFAPFPANFLGGVTVALGNSNNAGGAELIVGEWSKGGRARIYVDLNANLMFSDDAGNMLEEFAPFGTRYKGGITVASGPIENAGNGGADVIVGKRTGVPTVLIFADGGINGMVGDDPIFDTLTPTLLGFRAGANVAAGDTDNSGTFVEVLVAPAGGRGGTVKIFDDNADMGALVSDNDPDDQLAAFLATHSGGIQVAFGKVRIEAFGSTSNLPPTIPDQGTLDTSIFVPTSAGIVRDLDLTLSISHSFVGDLDVTLTHMPSGVSVALFTDIGGTDEGLMIRLNDEAGTDISTADNPSDGVIVGTFNPELTALLSAFDGVDASGEWRLSITDDSSSDTGLLFSWSLVFTF